MGIEITTGGITKSYRYYPYDAFYIDANGNLNTSGNGQQVREAYFNGTKYYPEGIKPPARIEIIRKPKLSDYSDIVVRAYTADNEVWYHELYPNGIIPFNELTFTKLTRESSIVASAKSYFPNGLTLNRATSKISVKPYGQMRPYDMTEVNDGRDFRVYCCGVYDSEVGRLYIIPIMVVNKNSYPLGSMIPVGTRVHATSLSGIFIEVPTQYAAVLRTENHAYYYNNKSSWSRVALADSWFGASNGMYIISNDFDMANYIVDGQVNTFTSHPDSQYPSRKNVVENLLIHCVDGIHNFLPNGLDSDGYRIIQALIGMLEDFQVTWTVPSTTTILSDSCCLEIDTPFPLAW